MENRLAETRKVLKMTQNDLAKRAGVSRPYISDIENGKYIPGGALMLKLAKTLNCRVEDIFFTPDVMHAERNGEAFPCQKKTATQ